MMVLSFLWNHKLRGYSSKKVTGKCKGIFLNLKFKISGFLGVENFGQDFFEVFKKMGRFALKIVMVH